MEDKDRHLVVVGIMAVGKSTVGRIVAGGLGRPFVDNDEELVARTGLTAAEYQERHGRDALHREELEILRHCLLRRTPSVITGAASVVDTEVGRHLLHEQTLVAWVDADEKVLAQRVAEDDGHRPDGTDEDTLRKQREDRHDLFDEVADIALRTDRSKEAAAEELLQWCRRLGLGSGG